MPCWERFEPNDRKDHGCGSEGLVGGQSLRKRLDETMGRSMSRLEFCWWSHLDLPGWILDLSFGWKKKVLVEIANRSILKEKCFWIFQSIVWKSFPHLDLDLSGADQKVTDQINLRSGWRTWIYLDRGLWGKKRPKRLFDDKAWEFC